MPGVARERRKVGSLGKQGEAAGEGGGSWQSSRPTPRLLAAQRAAQRGLAHICLQPVTPAPSLTVPLGTARLDFFDLRCLTRSSEARPPPGQPLQSQLLRRGGRRSTGESQPDQSFLKRDGCGHLPFLWLEKRTFIFHPAVPSFLGQSSYRPSNLCERLSLSRPSSL